MTKREKIEDAFNKITNYCVDNFNSTKEEVLENFDNGDEIDGAGEIAEWVCETLSGLMEDIYDVVDALGIPEKF